VTVPPTATVPPTDVPTTGATLVVSYGATDFSVTFTGSGLQPGTLIRYTFLQSGSLRSGELTDHPVQPDGTFRYTESPFCDVTDLVLTATTATGGTISTDPSSPPCTALLDTDGDGLPSVDEVNRYGTDPLDADSDDDRLSDGDEASRGTDPLDADTDDDRLSDGDEVLVHRTDPLDADTDDDGLWDGDEVLYDGTDPFDTDTDDDGLTDGDEVFRYGTSPSQRDTDQDRLTDSDELTRGTDPRDADTDGDGPVDGWEVDAGTDPLDPTSHP